MFRFAYLLAGRQEQSGSPKFLTFLLTHATPFVNPGRPSESSPKRFLCVGFWAVEPIAICFDGNFHRRNNEAISGLRETTVFPVAYVIPCVRFNDVVQSLMSDVCVWPLTPLVEAADIPASTPRFSLCDGYSSNRPERPPSSLQHSV